MIYCFIFFLLFLYFGFYNACFDWNANVLISYFLSECDIDYERNNIIYVIQLEYDMDLVTIKCVILFLNDYGCKHSEIGVLLTNAMY